MPRARRVLLVDNHDSYTGNLFQLLWQQLGDAPDVVESDAMDVQMLVAQNHSHIVIGPGPGTPHEGKDVGGSLELIRLTRAPLLGVCFGLQAIVVALGGRIDRSPAPAHGVIDEVRHEESVLFAGLAATFPAVRYHSLCVQGDPPAPLRTTAWASDGVLMAAEAPTRGLYGVQFHPESIGTPDGGRMIANFLATSSGSDARATGRW